MKNHAKKGIPIGTSLSFRWGKSLDGIWWQLQNNVNVLNETGL